MKLFLHNGFLIKEHSITVGYTSMHNETCKILNHKVGNDITMVLDTFQSTENNFWPIPTREVPIPVPDIVLVHLQRSKVIFDIQTRLSQEPRD